MPLLTRTAMERRNMRKFSMLMMYLAQQAMLLGIPAATIFYSNGATALAGLAVMPSRRCVNSCSRSIVACVSAAGSMASIVLSCRHVQLREHVQYVLGGGVLVVERRS